MKKQLFIAFVALFVSAALGAQTTPLSHSQNQQGKQPKKQTQEQYGTRTQTGRQETMQAGYKNNGQMTKAQKQSRNEERKALKNQQKDLKKQQKHQTSLNSEQYMNKEKTTTRNKGAHKAAPQNTAVKMAKSAGPGGKR